MAKLVFFFWGGGIFSIILFFEKTLTSVKKIAPPQKVRPALHYESGPKKLGANFEHFWVANWHAGFGLNIGPDS
jgi:hypothetical protein